MPLFLIGLELELGRLVALRRAIFGLGAAQLALTALAIGALAYLVGLVDWRGVVAGVALAMSATAFALNPEERGQLQQDYGQRRLHLLFQDMAVAAVGSTRCSLKGREQSRRCRGCIARGQPSSRHPVDRRFRPLSAESFLSRWQTGSREVMTAAAPRVRPARPWSCKSRYGMAPGVSG
jgi:hypothetical protein